jgi:hypothetical protein
MDWTEPAPGEAHNDGHDTEWEAADAVTPLTGKLRQEVLTVLAANPDGLTDDEGGHQLRTKIPDADRLTFGRRRYELVKDGLVRDSGERRPTPRGKRAIVWRAC